MEPIRVLYVEDNPADRELTRRHLERHAPHLKLREVETLAEALDQLAVGDVDLVLADYRLPDGTGLDLLEAIKAKGLPVPVVLVTGSGDAEAAVRLLKAGAAEYVVKRPGYLKTLPPVLEGAFRWFQSASELRRTPVRVLYAEHDPADVDLTRRAFIEHGPHLYLEVASTGWEALARLRAAAYDVFLLDYRLPDLSGLDILKALREERIRVPVVMVTGQGDEETAVEAFKLGVDDYIIKREGYLAKLPSTLENVLAQRRLADENEALLVLNTLAESIATLQDLSDLVPRVAQAARDLLRAQTSILWLVEGTELRAAGWVGIEESVAHALRFQVEEPLLDRAAAQRQVALPDLVAAAARSNPTAAILARTVFEDAGGTLAVSLVHAGRLSGVLALASPGSRHFGATEKRLLMVLANHAAIAIENARLYQQVRDQLEEIRRTQAQLLQTEKLAVMGQLLAGVAHELNNPLAVVMAQAELLHRTAGSGQLAERAEKIVRATDQCTHIVRNFLALARQRPTEREPVRLNEVVQQAVELLAYQLRVDNVEVRLDLAEKLPLFWGDPSQLHQVVVNLVTNAHQAMREAAPPRRLTLATRCDSERGRVSLEVTDSGPGIPPETQPRIFEPFFTTKRLGQGTGLGLSLCQGLVEGHGGTIGVASQPRHGATFRIEFPVAAGPVAEAEARAIEGAPPVRGKRILVVDDEPEVARALAGMLSVDGHEVDTASDGTLALDKLAERDYDLILSDIRMPNLDGLGLYRELERRYPHLLRRVVWLTGDTLSPTIAEFLERPGRLTLTKPFALADVRRAVLRALGAKVAQGPTFRGPAKPDRSPCDS